MNFPENPVGTLLHLALGLVLTMGLGSLGSLLPFPASSPGLRLARCLGAGVALASLVGWVLGQLGLLSPGVLWGWWLALAALLAGRARVTRELFGAAWRDGACPAPALAVVGATVFGALAPNSHYDVEAYHYTLPLLYLERGSTAWTGTSSLEGYVGILHSLYAFVLGLGGEVQANLLGPVFLLILALVGSALARDVRPGSEGVASLLIVLTPVAFLQAFGGLTDLPVAAFLALAYADWLHLPEERLHFRWFALWCAVAMLGKLTALMPVAALVLALALTRPGATFDLVARHWKGTSLLVGGILVLMVRNTVVTGNPFYPVSLRWLVSTLHVPVPGEFPWLLFTPFQPGDERAWQDAWHPLLLAGLALAGSRWRLAVPSLLVFAMMSVLHSEESRYALAALVWLAPLSAAGISGGLAGSDGLSRACRWAWTGTCLLLALMLAASLAPRAAVVAGLETPHEYLAKRSPLQEAYAFLSQERFRGCDVVLMERRAMRCPLPFVVLSGPGDHWKDPPEHAELVLWNLEGNAAAQLVAARLRVLGPGTYPSSALAVPPLSELPEDRLRKLLRRKGVEGRGEVFVLDRDVRARPNWIKVMRAFEHAPVIYSRDGVVIQQRASCSGGVERAGGLERAGALEGSGALEQELREAGGEHQRVE